MDQIRDVIAATSHHAITWLLGSVRDDVVAEPAKQSTRHSESSTEANMPKNLKGANRGAERPSTASGASPLAATKPGRTRATRSQSRSIPDRGITFSKQAASQKRIENVDVGEQSVAPKSKAKSGKFLLFISLERSSLGIQ